MKIKIDNCKDAKNCMKCVKICPVNIIVIKPVGAKKMSPYVKKWDIRAIFRDMCNGCMRCVKICPDNRIKLKI